MDDEIKYFLDFEDNETENDDIKATKSNGFTALQKAIGIILVCVIFILTLIYGYLIKADDVDYEASVIVSTGTSDIENLNISDKYKVKTFELLKEDAIILRGKLNITKDDIKSLSDDELSKLFRYISSLNNYSWITVSFADGTGIVTLPENKSVYFYGKLDENDLISHPYGTILTAENDKFVFIESKETDSEGATHNQSIGTENSDSEINGNTVYITATGTKYHIAGCSYLTDSKASITLNKAKEQGYLPCSRCIK